MGGGGSRPTAVDVILLSQQDAPHAVAGRHLHVLVTPDQQGYLLILYNRLGQIVSTI